MNELGFFIGILGLIATLVGSALAYFTFINPMVRMRHYLSKPSKWERFDFGMQDDQYLWRYMPHPEFTINRDPESKEWSREEPWMRRYHLADKTTSSCMVYLSVNGQVMHSEEFISLDGGRYFVPLPKVKHGENENDNIYFYTDMQRRISRIIGNYYRFDTLEEFIKAFEIKAAESKEEAE